MMSTLHVSVTFRPLRLGLCVRAGNLEDFGLALRLTHCFWGGVFNPIIPFDDDGTGTRLIWLYACDALYSASDDEETVKFADSFPALKWPFYPDGLFIESAGTKEPHLLDMAQAVLKTDEYRRRNWLPADYRATVAEWEPSDSFANVFLATFGAFPEPEEVDRDYGAFIEERLSAERVQISPSDPVPADLVGTATPSVLARRHLRPKVFDWHRRPGLFVGAAGDFSDLVNFWNLRAAGYPLIFFDPSQPDRLRPLTDEYVKRIHATPTRPAEPPGIPVWSSNELDYDAIAETLGGGLSFSTISEATWNGLNVKPSLMAFDTSFTVASLEEGSRGPRATIALPAKPFLDHSEFFHQNVVISVGSVGTSLVSDGSTLTPPFVPDLNEYYGRELFFDWRRVRAEPEAVGVIERVTANHLSLTALEHEKVIARVFDACGFVARPSQPGRVATRLIQQMGGLQGCRVFKIRGVRQLIRQYAADDSFRKGEAEKVIGNFDEATQSMRFSEYEGLYLRHQGGSRLRPLDAFLDLIRNGVLRAGLRLKCPHCELQDWVSLDDVASQVACAFCATRFDVTEQLRDRDWFYRRSGLFGRSDPDEQKGSVPVTLVLQSLQLNFHDKVICFSTSLNLAEQGQRDTFCETDFVVVLRQMRRLRHAVVIGECKTGMEITEQDASNLGTVADRLGQIGVDPFVLFAKTSPFSPDEIERCKLAQAPYTERVIILTVEDLEVLNYHDRKDEMPNHCRFVHDARGLAERTTALHFGGARRTEAGWDT